MKTPFRARHAALRAMADEALRKIAARAEAVARESSAVEVPFGLEVVAEEGRRRMMARAWALFRQREGGDGGPGVPRRQHDGEKARCAALAALSDGAEGFAEEELRFLRRACETPFGFHAIAEVGEERCLVVDALSGREAEAAVADFARPPRPDDIWFGHAVVMDGVVLFTHRPLLACGRRHGALALCSLMLGAGRAAWALRREHSRAFSGAAALRMVETLFLAEMRHCAILTGSGRPDCEAGDGRLAVRAEFRGGEGCEVPPSVAAADGLRETPTGALAGAAPRIERRGDVVEVHVEGAAALFAALPVVDAAFPGVPLHLAGVRPA